MRLSFRGCRGPVMSLLLILLGSGSAVMSAAAEPVSILQGPAGDAFYASPPFPNGPRGSVIWSRPQDATATMALPSGAPSG